MPECHRLGRGPLRIAMHVTIEIEERELPAEYLEYGRGFFRRYTFEKVPARTVYSVIAIVYFETQELEVIQRADLYGHPIWKGPEETYLPDDWLKFNLELPRRDGCSGPKYANALDLGDIIHPECLHLAYEAYKRRSNTCLVDLIDGHRHVVYDCPSLAAANTVEYEFREGLVLLKQLLVFNDKPASRVTTFEL